MAPTERYQEPSKSNLNNAQFWTNSKCSSTKFRKCILNQLLTQLHRCNFNGCLLVSAKNALVHYLALFCVSTKGTEATKLLCSGTRFIPRNIYSPKIIRWINAEHFSDRQQIARMPIARKTWRLLELTQWHIHRIYYTPAHWSKGKASAFFDRKKIRP